MFFSQILFLSISFIQIIHTTSITNTIGTVDEAGIATVLKRPSRHAQDEILPANFDLNNVRYTVPRPVIRSLSEPAQAEYADFISTLYHFDKTRIAPSRLRRHTVSATVGANNKRQPRAIIFRPLFVYKQQEVRRRKGITDKPKQTVSAKPSAAQIYQQAIMTGQRQQFQG